jgi:N-acetylmuramoyl-L-alanine amidase
VPPRIVTARSIGLEFITARLGAMGPENSTVGHYSAGARAKNRKEGIARAIAFHADHKVRLGAAGIGYHYLITDDGTIICGRSTFHNGAHVLKQNSGRIGVNMPGTLSKTVRDRPTKRQARAFNWLLHNAHTDAMPRVHRTDRDLSKLEITTHKDLMDTSCPGLFRTMYLRGGLPWVEPTGDSVEDDGFVDLTAEDEQLIADVEAGNEPDHDADAEVFGPDDSEADSGGDDTAELPEADEEFDEDLSEELEEIKAGMR